MCYQVVAASRLLLALGMLLPVLGVAETSGKLPTNYLAVASLKALAQTPEYTKLDSHYEKNKRDKGDAWINSPEGKAMAEVREYLQKTALSAKVEMMDGRKNVVFTQGVRKAVLGSFIPPEDEHGLNSVADIISGLIIDRARGDAKFKAVMAAIDTAENPPLPDINRSSAPMVLGAFVEPQAPYPLWLPEPGPSSKADLHPRAEEARQRGLKAASNGDWPGAVAAFKEANSFAHCSPPLMFNLGLAYQRGGWPVQAAMYYRAYVTALPDAPNVAEIHAEIQKLIVETEARSLREFNEAEHLADKLSATPPSAGARSLRQTALESMATYAYLGGLVDRGDALVRKISALPGSSNVAEKREYPDKHGLYAAAFSRDAKLVEDIVARFGSEYSQEIILNYQAYAWGTRQDLGRVRKVISAYPSGVLDDSGTGITAKYWIRQPWAYELLETMHGLKLDGSKELYVGTLLPDLHSVFWNGRPDIAQRLARRTVEQYRKLNSDGSILPRWNYTSYLIPNALLGNRKAIVQEIERWKYPVIDDSIIEVAALYMVASMTPADAEATIMDMVRLRIKDLGTGISISEDRWPNMFPETYFALAIAKGDSIGALKYLERADDLSDESYQVRIWRALRFAVATGRSQLALVLSEKSPHDWNTLVQLNRLAANPGANEAVRERVRRYAATMSGGWRPTDAGHARKVWLHLRHAHSLADEKQYGLMPRDAEKTAREKPEELPASLAAHAIVLWMGAMAARLED